MKKMAIAAGIVMVMAAGMACGGGDSKTIDLGNGDKIKVGTDLPDDFPDSFPVYDDADLQGALQGEQEGIDGIIATWTTGDDLDDVTAFYEDAFDDGPWVVVTNGAAGGSTFWAVEERDGDKTGYVAVSGGDEVTIIATVGDDPSSATTDGDSDADADSESDDEGTDDIVEPTDDEGSDSDGGDAAANLPDEVDLPDGFPSDIVSMPDGARVTTAQSYTANGAESFLVGFHTKDSIDKVGDYFKSELEGNGFTQSVQTSDGTGVYAAYSENADGTGTIVVISVNDNGSVEGYREGVVQVTEG